jgi:hypothetical protein
VNSITSLELQENPQTDFASVLASCNLLRLHLMDGSSRELTGPKLGREFVSGNLEDGYTLGFFRKESLRAVEFTNAQNQNFGPLSFTRRAIGELLALQPFPALARYSYLGKDAAMQQSRVLGVARGFLLTDSVGNLAIPLAALSVLELDCA